MPLAAVGASVLGIAGCTVANVRDQKSFVFSCPAEVPSAKLEGTQYTDVPDSTRDKIEVKLSCHNKKSGDIAAPSRIDERIDAFDTSEKNERQYRVDLALGVDIEEDPLIVQNYELDDPSHPNVGVIAIEGMVNFEYITDPEPVSRSR